MRFLRWLIYLVFGAAAFVLIGVVLWNFPLFWKVEYQVELLAGTAVSALEHFDEPTSLPSAASSANENQGAQFELEVIDANIAGDVKLIGDMDGDGFADLIIGGMPNEQLNWYRYPDWKKTVIATPDAEFTTDGALGDVDGDGDLDVVVPDGGGTDNLLWFENPLPNGEPTDGSQWSRHIVGSIGSWGKDVELADFDANGRLDVATRHNTAAMIFFQTGADTWQQMTFSAVDLGNEGMASGDVDGDGQIDLVLRGVWVRNPGGSAAQSSTNWTQYNIGSADSDFKALVVDLNQDGQMDVLFSSSENSADVNWWTPQNGDPTASWTKQTIVPALDRAHTLQAADMDLDGDVDVVLGQMHTSSAQEIMVMYNTDGQATSWEKQLVDTGGLHNGVVADIGNDGDFDIYGANWTGNPPVRLWENRLDAAGSVDRWSYQQIADNHVQTFGLGFGDINGDGGQDIVSGRYWYQNPGGDLTDAWAQSIFPDGMHAFTVLDVDGDARADVMAQKDEGEIGIYWLEATDGTGAAWTATKVGSVDGASHGLGAQGYRTTAFNNGTQAVVLITSGNGIYYFAVPDNPEGGSWPRVHVNSNPSDEGFAVGDVDGDGALDIAGTTGSSKRVEWYRNPGDGSAEWQAFQVGSFEEAVFPDRTELADLNGDGRLDIIVTEENGKDADAQTFWWAQPQDPTSGNWPRTLIATQATTNSLDVADMDDDGDIDVILAEHRGSLKLAIWANDGSGNFSEKQIDAGKESHLGARTVDLEGDGDLDIVSIAWDNSTLLHLWRNDANGNGGGGPTDAAYLPVATKPEATPSATETPGSATATPPSEPPAGLIALYTFQTGSGDVVHDTSGQGTPLNLRVADVSAVNWLPGGGLTISDPTIISAESPANKLISAVQASNALSVSIWLSPVNTNQDGPARIVTYSLDTGSRNFTLGQESSSYDMRLRTTATSGSGIPSLATASGTVNTARTHLVYTRAADGVAHIYLDGEEVATTEIGGDLSNWDSTHTFALANEISRDRPWLGDLYSVAIYDRALSASEVSQQFQGSVAALLLPEVTATPSVKSEPVAAQPEPSSSVVQALEEEATEDVATPPAAAAQETNANPAATTGVEQAGFPAALLLGGSLLLLLLIGLGLIWRQRRRSSLS